MLTCPACSAPLRAERHLGIEIDLCTGCHGIWFDAGELEMYRAQRRPEAGVQRTGFRPDSTRPAQRCPRCESETLLPGNGAGGHTLSVCSGCRGAFVPDETVAKLGGGPSWQPPSVGEAFADGVASGAGDLGLQVLEWVLSSIFEGL